MSAPFHKTLLHTTVGAALLVATAAAAPTPLDGAGFPAHGGGTHTDDDGRGTPYKVDKTDNVCGLDEPRALTDPAKVDYEKLLNATPEVKAIKRRKIDKESAEGIRLMTEARSRVLDACEKVRSDEGHCSVWKKISRRDGTPIPDITDEVKKEIESDDENPPSVSAP